ncbi:MAG: TIGR00725 family protein [Dehalococcoidales bacterium]|nr:TIGR00725 family protein [Dehalococcoidales bacterium]
MSQRKLTIAVIGAREPSLEEAAIAEETGREIALKGAVLVCGGLGGTMEAACRGAVSQDGLTIGILPGTDPNDANPYVRIPIATGAGLARNMAVVQSAGAVIAIGGSYGTLSEIAYARANNIPVIGINTWHLSRENTEDSSIIRVTDPKEAVAIAIESAKKKTGILTWHRLKI